VWDVDARSLAGALFLAAVLGVFATPQRAARHAQLLTSLDRTAPLKNILPKLCLNSCHSGLIR